MKWTNDIIIREIHKLRTTSDRIHWQDVAALARRVRDDTASELKEADLTEPILAHREYLAVVLHSLRYPDAVQPLWLVASGEYQAQLLVVADETLKKWKQHELDMEQLRKEVYEK